MNNKTNIEIKEIVIGAKAELIEHFNSFVKPYSEREKEMVLDVFYEVDKDLTIESQISKIEESESKIGMIFFIVHTKDVAGIHTWSFDYFYVKIKVS